MCLSCFLTDSLEWAFPGQGTQGNKPTLPWGTRFTLSLSWGRKANPPLPSVWGGHCHVLPLPLMRSWETQGFVFHGFLMGKQHMDGERLKKGLQGIRIEKRPISWGIFLISGDGCTVWGVLMGVWEILYGMPQMSLALPCTEGDKSNPRADFQPHCTFIFPSSY